MAVLIGNAYNLWISATIGGTYVRFAGQQDGTLGGTRQTADASHKTSGGVSLKIPGLIELPIDLAFVADVPDTGGLTVAETAFKNGTTVGVALRKGGSTATATDNIFLCEMYVTAYSLNLGLNNAVTGSVKFEPAFTPTTNITLA